MHFLAWAMIIGLMIGIGILLKRSWLSSLESEDTAATETGAASEMPAAGAGSVANQFAIGLQSRVQGLRSGIGELGVRLTGSGNRAPNDVATLFRHWSATAFVKDPEIQMWLASLTDEQILALTEHLADFCHDMGFELDWLLEEHIANQSVADAELVQGLSEIVALYSRASFQAVALQREVELFRAYHSYMQNPLSQANRELGKHLFGMLMEAGKCQVTISEHLASSPRQQQQQIMETIQRIAAEQPDVLKHALRAVLFNDETADRSPSANQEEPSAASGNAERSNGSPNGTDANRPSTTPAAASAH